MPNNFCNYERLADGRLRCPLCGDETRNIWPLITSTWPLNVCAAMPRPPYTPGPGDYLFQIIKGLGLTATTNCQCLEMIVRMNAWGIPGCKANRKEIADHLNHAYTALTWTQWADAVTRAAISGLALKIDPRNPARSLVTAAIALAERSPPTH